MWLVAAGAGAIAQWAINQALIGAAFKLANPAARIRDELFGREALHNDATELCAALLVAVGMTVSSLTLIIALPLATLLQRSFRHARLLNEARADSKTGLLNAATWEREAVAEVARAVRTSSPLAVALLDLDRFKQINDTYGHLIGDEVLRQIADTMTGLLREYDLAGRFGGEEFVMLLPQTRAPDAFKIADRVRAHIARLPISTTGGEQVAVTVSIGVAALDAGSSRELTELLAAADAALYRAKASGRDQVQMISTSRGLSAVRSSAQRRAGPGPGGALPRSRCALAARDRRSTPDELGLGGEFENDEFGGDEFDERFRRRRVSAAGRGHREHRDHLGVRGLTGHLRRRPELAHAADPGRVTRHPRTAPPTWPAPCRLRPRPGPHLSPTPPTWPATCRLRRRPGPPPAAYAVDPGRARCRLRRRPAPPPAAYAADPGRHCRLRRRHHEARSLA